MKSTTNHDSSRLVLPILLFISFSFQLGSMLQIRAKPCTNALGDEGTCMFVWECIKTEGKHLGTCVDGFLFGSCCGHNETQNWIDTSSIHNSNNHRPTISSTSVIPYTTSKPRPKPPSTAYTNYTTAYYQKPTKKPISRPTSRPTTRPTIRTTPRPSGGWPTPPSTVTSTRRPTTTKPTVSQVAAANFTLTKPWPTAPSPIHSQVWPAQSNAPPNVLQTFRPPIFSIFSTNRPPPPGTNIYLRPTFRPPVVRPTSIYQQIQNTRTTTTARPTTFPTLTSPLISSSQHATQPISTFKPFPSETHSSSNFITEKPTPKPFAPASKMACGKPQLMPQTKVVGGKNAAFGAWPWQVSVRRTSFFGFSSTHRCGGAVLNNQWIATAGHCVDDLLLTQIRIRVGEYDFASAMEPYPYVERGAKKKVVHPRYNFFTYENDLALVQLDEPIEYQPHVGPICLPPEDFEIVGRNATVTGWGRLSEGGILPSVLQEVKVPIVSNDKCKNMFLTAGRHEYIPEIFMCAGYDEGGRDSCQGDSGGPLQVQGDNGHWYLAGIISWGIGCGEPSLPGVCTRISKFREWILSNIN